MYLEWFSQAFWAQSVDLKRQFGWSPPPAAEFPSEWKRQAGEVLAHFGYEVLW